ncbi:cytochrome P450 [Rhodococcus sp. WS4]|nr:cytochrome P450 [Rhodococcus sp. WS4]
MSTAELSTTTDGSFERDLARLLAGDPDSLGSVFTMWDRARLLGPTHWTGTRHLIFGYDEVKSILNDSRLGNNGFYVGTDAEYVRSTLTAAELELYWEVADFESKQLGRSDGPDHTRLRDIARRTFTPRRIALLRESVTTYADELLDSVAGAGVVEAVSAVTHVLPLMVIVDLLGVPQQDRALIRDWSCRLGRWRGNNTPEILRDTHTAMTEFRDYVRTILESKRTAEPETDLIAALMGAGDGGRLDAEELVAFYVMLLLAGHETTTNLMGIGLLELHRQPEQWRGLCADPSSARAGIDELLRFVSPVQYVGRVALETIHLGETVIEEGQSVLPIIGSANHDPKIFENPEQLDLGRANAREQIAFGYGPHFCLGQQLAQLEASIVFRKLATRFPDMRVDISQARFGGSLGLRALEHLPVDFGPDHGESD